MLFFNTIYKRRERDGWLIVEGCMAKRRDGWLRVERWVAKIRGMGGYVCIGMGG